MKHYTGHCHCKTVRYEAQLDLETGVMECNCSHCQTKGFLLSFIPKENFILLSGDDHLTEYRFHKNVISHLFCDICGTQCFGYGEQNGVPMVAVNVRTLEDVDIVPLKKIPVDGKSF